MEKEEDGMPDENEGYDGETDFGIPGEEPGDPNKDQGYQDEVSSEDIANLARRAQSAEKKASQLAQALSSMGEDKKDVNILHLQISTEKMLEKLEHFYRGDIAKNEEGNVKWVKQKNRDLITFNEYGVTSLMEIVTKYIDRNTILSSYSEERIYEIMGDLGDELTLFILCNYVQIGMNTYFKKTKFRIIIATTLHIIESTYRRALRGKTLEELNQSRIISQFGEAAAQSRSNQAKTPESWLKRQFSRI